MQYDVEFKDNQWEVLVTTGTGTSTRITYPAWNKQVALSYAKAEAKKKKHQPSTVLVHHKDSGKVISTFEYN